MLCSRVHRHCSEGVLAPLQFFHVSSPTDWATTACVLKNIEIFFLLNICLCNVLEFSYISNIFFFQQTTVYCLLYLQLSTLSPAFNGWCTCRSLPRDGAVYHCDISSPVQSHVLRGGFSSNCQHHGQQHLLSSAWRMLFTEQGTIGFFLI